MTDGPVPDERLNTTVSPPVTDPIGLALTAIGAGAVAGAFVITLGVLALRLAQGGAVRTATNATDFALLSAAVLAGPVVAVTVTMTTTSVIGDLWRRGVASAIAVFCTFLLAGLAAPLDVVGGRAGLGGFAVLLFGATIALTRRARHIASQ